MFPCGAIHEEHLPRIDLARHFRAEAATPLPYEWTYLDVPGAKEEGTKQYLNRQYNTCFQAYWLHAVTWMELKAGRPNPEFRDAHAATLYERDNPLHWDKLRPTINDVGSSPTRAATDICNGFRGLPGYSDLPLDMFKKKAEAFGWIDGANLNLVRRCFFDFGPLCAEAPLPDKFWSQPITRNVWDDSEPLDWRHNHFVPICAFHPTAGFGAYSWGIPKTLTNGFVQKYCSHTQGGGSILVLITKEVIGTRPGWNWDGIISEARALIPGIGL